MYLSSCGFHTPYKENTTNFKIINVSNDIDFEEIIADKLDKNKTTDLTLKLLKVQKSKDNGYSGNTITSYNLELIVDFAVYKDEKVIFKNQLSRSKYLTNNADSNTYQDSQAYKSLQNDIATTIIRKIQRL